MINRFNKSDINLGWSYGSGKCDAISFKTSVDKKLLGMGIYTGDYSRGKETYTCYYVFYEESTDIKSGVFTFENNETKIFSFYLEHPILIRQGIKYDVSISLQGRNSFLPKTTGWLK